MRDKSMLDKQVTQIINNNTDNRDLKTLLTDIFLKNDLASSTINSLFSGEIYFNTLTDKQQIYLIKGLNKHFTSLNIKLEEYFADKTLYMAEHDITPKQPLPTKIKLEKLIMVDDTTFCGVISYKDVYEYYTQNLIIYNVDFQREGKYVQLGKTYVKTPSVDSKSISSMVELIQNNQLETSSITLSYLIREGVEPNFTITEDNGLYTLVADKLLINDGFHRCMASINATAISMADNGKHIDKYFIIKVMIADKDRIKLAVNQSFLMSQTNDEYVKNIDMSDALNVFIDKMEDHMSITMGNTFEETKYLKLDTTRSTIRKALELLRIDTESKSTLYFMPKKLAENLDVLIEELKRRGTYVDSYELYLIYTIVAYDMNNIDGLSNKLVDVGHKFRLGLKHYNINGLLKYFDII